MKRSKAKLTTKYGKKSSPQGTSKKKPQTASTKQRAAPEDVQVRGDKMPPWGFPEQEPTVSRTLAADTSERVGAENSTVEKQEVTPEVGKLRYVEPGIVHDTFKPVSHSSVEWFLVIVAFLGGLLMGRLWG